MKILSLLLAAVPLVSLGTAKDTRYMFTFGDSYTKTEFNINGAKPNANNIIGNPNFPGSTSSGGHNWLGWLITQFNKKNTVTYAYNFADGGAVVDSSIITPFRSDVRTFTDQIQSFKKHLASKPSWAPWNADNSLVGVWLGINDIGRSYTLNNATAVIRESVDMYFEHLEYLYSAGIRNFFLLSVPPTDKTPKLMGLKNKPTDNIRWYNNHLAEHLAKFKAAHKDIDAVLIDTHKPFNKAIDAPKDYGAPDAKCYKSDGKSCLWYNNYHPGIAIHKLVAADVGVALGANHLW
uniref:CBM1 domain-containing protein n=1 Tax=Bionectria ochroleuca TaxID=29856 RepID=A0A8H7K358_BIOOC